MYIIAEFFDFVDSVITNVEESKQTSIYKVLEHIIKRDSENAEMAIPAYILFGNNPDYIDIIRNDHIKHNPVYNDIIECFVFKGINDLFFGIVEVLRKINEEYPNDTFVLDNTLKMKIFMKIVKESITLDELCDAMSGSNFKI
jgi:hypothetical protein